MVDKKTYIREFEVRAKVEVEDGKVQFSGLAVPWNTETNIGGMFREMFRKGAFTRVIQEKHNVRALINHKDDKVLGSTQSGTLTIREGIDGLIFENDPPNTQPARDLQVLVDRGDVGGVSIRFRSVKEVWHDSDDDNKLELREVIDADLLELSILTFPQYTETSVELRSANEECYKNHKREQELAAKKEVDHKLELETQRIKLDLLELEG